MEGMVRPLRIQYPGAVYHVTNRGNERKAIFKDDYDRDQFLQILASSVETYNITLHGYVMMPNHFHLLVETPLGNLGEFMRHFNITYTSYFNRQHRRSGHLYQGRYKSFLVEKEAYLSACSRYIHLNPVKVGAFKKRAVQAQKDYLLHYKWSSLPGYLALGKRNEFVTYGFVLEEFGGETRSGRKNYKERILQDLSDGVALHEKIVGQSLLGGEDFVSWVRQNFIENKHDRERPSIGKIHRYATKEEILEVLEKRLNASAADIVAWRGLDRQIAMDVLYRFGGFTNKAIGEMMGLDYSTISLGRKRLAEKRNKDKKLDKILRNIDLQISRLKF
jgi:putative transposase